MKTTRNLSLSTLLNEKGFSSIIYIYIYRNLSSTEIRRQIHIQSEQKRRAQIKDGFEELRNELPTCLNKKMSKVALLHRSKRIILFFFFLNLTPFIM